MARVSRAEPSNSREGRYRYRQMTTRWITVASVELEIPAKLLLLCAVQPLSLLHFRKAAMSSYQIRQLSLGGVLDQAVALTKNHFGPLLSIVAVTFLPFNLAANLIVATMLPAIPSIQATPEEQQVFADAYFKMLRMMGILWLPLVLAAVVSNAAVVKAIADVYLGKSFTTWSAIRQAFKKILPLIGTGILMSLTMTVGLMLCIIPGIIAILWFSLATQVVVIEGDAGIPAMKRSKALMKGNIGAFIALMIVLGLIGLLINGGVSLISQPHLRAVVATAIGAVMTVFTSAAVVVFYFSARCRNEQFDLQLLADNIGAEYVLEADDDDRSAE